MNLEIPVKETTHRGWPLWGSATISHSPHRSQVLIHAGKPHSRLHSNRRLVAHRPPTAPGRACCACARGTCCTATPRGIVARFNVDSLNCAMLGYCKLQKSKDSRMLGFLIGYYSLDCCCKIRIAKCYCLEKNTLTEGLSLKEVSRTAETWKKGHRTHVQKELPAAVHKMALFKANNAVFRSCTGLLRLTSAAD